MPSADPDHQPQRAGTRPLRCPLVFGAPRRDELNTAFAKEPGVGITASAIDGRWKELLSAGTDTSAVLRPVDARIEAFIRKVDIVFRPDEGERSPPRGRAAGTGCSTASCDARASS